MKKLLVLFISLTIIKATCLAQLFIEKTPFDSLKTLPNIAVTLQVKYWQGEQIVSDYSIDIGKAGKMKLKKANGEKIKIESFINLLTIFKTYGWEMQQFSVIPFNTVKPNFESYVDELLYTIILRQK